MFLLIMLILLLKILDLVDDVDFNWFNLLVLCNLLFVNVCDGCGIVLLYENVGNILSVMFVVFGGWDNVLFVCVKSVEVVLV